MLFVHQVIASSESHQMSVVSWCWDGDGPGAAHVGVAQLVGEDLQLIRREVVVVPEHVVMRRPAGALRGGGGKVTQDGFITPPTHKYEHSSATGDSRGGSHLNTGVTAQVEVKF